MSDSPIGRRWGELTSMLNSDEGRIQIQLDYLRIAANASASALAVLSVTPVGIVEAILNHEFPPHLIDDSSTETPGE
jgi:hypothetical protein